MVDINADGWLDIYVCNSGDVRGDNKQNEFFINNGDGTFTDRAVEMGLADLGYSPFTSAIETPLVQVKSPIGPPAPAFSVISSNLNCPLLRYNLQGF